MSDDNQECTCHICPPCGFCEGLSEKEAELYAYEGLDALRKFRREKEDKNEQH